MKTCAQCQIKYPDALDFCPQDGSPLPTNGVARGATQALYDALIGTTVDGRYQIEAKLGEGGMGVVYAARHVIIDKRVAMKVLKAEAQEDPTAGQRFIQEAKSASKINHANIVDITDFGMLADGSAYFVMEFLEGQTLGDVIRQGPVAPTRAISIAAQVARGLHAAHSKGIIHRDLKPENIFLLEREGEQDHVKIVDFGIAKLTEGSVLGAAAGQRLTQAGMVLGTPEYMSPEQATGKETDHRVDEYALGCIMYEMLTGDVPFRGDTSAGTLTKHVFEQVVPPRKKLPDLAIPVVLESVVLKAMSKQPPQRYPDMRELLGALDQAAMDLESGREVPRPARDEANLATAMSSDDLDQLTVPPRSRGRMPMLVGGGVALIAVVAIGVWLARGGTGSAGEKKTQVAMVAPPSVTPTPTPTPSTPPSHKSDLPPPVANIQITLQTVPDAADVLQDGHLLGKTPQTIEMPPSATPLHFTFQRSGYEDLTKVVTPDRNSDVSVTLRAKAASKHGSPHSSSHSRSDGEKPHHAAGNNDLRNPFDN